MLAWLYARSKLELGHFLDLLGNNPGLKPGWISVQVLILPFANTSRAKESSPNIGFFPCLPLLRHSALFFPVDHFCDAIICMFSPTHPQEAHDYGFYSLLPLVYFQEARISQTTHEQSIFHGNLLTHFFPECGCSITPGFLTCEKNIFLLVLAVYSDNKFRWTFFSIIKEKVTVTSIYNWPYFRIQSGNSYLTYHREAVCVSVSSL